MLVLMLSNTLIKDRSKACLINGMSISVKRTFVYVKYGSTLQDELKDIELLIFLTFTTKFSSELCLRFCFPNAIKSDMISRFVTTEKHL